MKRSKDTQSQAAVADPGFRAGSCRKHGCNIVEVIGELAFDTVEQLQEAMNGIKIDNSDPIIIDMSRLDFIDSRGAAFLLWTKENFEGRPIALAEIPIPVYDTLAGLYLTDRFPVFCSVKDALVDMLKVSVYY